MGVTPESGVTFAEIERARTVLCVAFEPEDEAPIVFLRLRKAARKNRTRVVHLGQWTTSSVQKTFGELLACVPGAEAAAIEGIAKHAPDLDEGLRGENAVVLVGERAASVPGLFSALHDLVERTGVRLAWIPRRAGDRGALETGCVPSLLPGGRRVGDDAARVAVENAWGVPLPAAPGRDATEILEAASSRELGGLVVGGVDPFDLPDPDLALRALDNAGFVVSLELRHSAVTERADVVLPVAASDEKAGSFLNWEGRTRPFDITIEGVGTLPDCRVLDTLAVEMDVDLFTQTPAAARGDYEKLGPASALRWGHVEAETGRSHRGPGRRPGDPVDLAPADRQRVAAGRRAAPQGHPAHAGRAAVREDRGRPGRHREGEHRTRRDHAADRGRRPARRRRVAAGQLRRLRRGQDARRRSRRRGEPRWG